VAVLKQADARPLPAVSNLKRNKAANGDFVIELLGHAGHVLLTEISEFCSRNPGQRANCLEEFVQLAFDDLGHGLGGLVLTCSAAISLPAITAGPTCSRETRGMRRGDLQRNRAPVALNRP